MSTNEQLYSTNRVTICAGFLLFRLEQEKRQQEEMEKQLQKQREIEREKEKERQKAFEQREAARK